MNVQAFTWKITVRYYKQLYIFILKAQSGKEKIPLRSRKGNIVKNCVCDLKMFLSHRHSGNLEGAWEEKIYIQRKNHSVMVE